MGEDRKASKFPRTEDVIAAFDRERAQAQELRRRHYERVRGSREDDRPAHRDANAKREYR
jgi:hypothetical protein